MAERILLTFAGFAALTLAACGEREATPAGESRTPGPPTLTGAVEITLQIRPAIMTTAMTPNPRTCRGRTMRKA